MLTIDEVTAIWKCHRVTVLRLMKRGALVPVDWVDDLPRFDRTQVLKLKNKLIAVYPHLTRI
jgi:hypothetical protein